jgi:flagellar biosynthetic protein FlhB
VSDNGEDSGEKTFDPTPQRLAEARRKGDIPRSADVTAAATYLAFLAVCATAGATALVGAASVLELFIAQPDRLVGLVLGPGGPQFLGSIVVEILTDLAPFLLVPIGAVLVSLFAQQAITFSGDKIQPKLSRLSILANAGKKFGVGGIVEFLKSLVKLAAVAVALFFYLTRHLDPMIGASTAEATVLGAMLMDSLVVLLTITTVIAVTVAGVDVVWQRFDHTRRLRMSFQEMREENKQSEGDPHMKAQRRSRAEAIATNRMLLDVPKADVVIVNPTHVAVALKWSRAKGSAPTCVAKGEGELALKIREIAGTAGVPLHEDPPTARALLASVEVGREIRPEHYRAVAAAIRFSERMRTAARARGLRL